MTTALLILAGWCALSVPAAVLVGRALKRQGDLMQPDRIVVERLLAGRPVEARDVDRDAAIHHLTAEGHTAGEIAHRLRLGTETVRGVIRRTRKDAHV